MLEVWRVYLKKGRVHISAQRVPSKRATSPDTNALLSSLYFTHVLFHNIFQLKFNLSIQLKLRWKRISLMS